MHPIAFAAIGSCAFHAIFYTGVVAGRFEVEDPEDEGEGEERLCGLDGAEDICLGRAFGESTAGKAEARDAEQGEQEANDGGESSGSAVELRDRLEKAVPVVIQWLDGDDRAQATPLPGRSGGARNADVPT